MDFLAQVVVWLNAVANAVGQWVLAPIALVPGWLSNTLIAALTGIVMLVVFKHTSNQRAIKKARADIKAQMLAMRLFKENVAVTLMAQAGVLWGVFRLISLSLVPVLIMAIPLTLVLAQLGLWYQARPLHVGEDSVITMKLNGAEGFALPVVSLEPTKAMEASVGPLYIRSKREVCWRIRASADGEHRLVFDVDGQKVDKELAIGNGFMRVSTERPGWSWTDALFNPWERPLAPGEPIHSIAIDYPTRPSWIYGTDYWVIYWFVVSLVVAFMFRKALGVSL